MADKKASATLDDFDAACADRVAVIIGANRDKLNLTADQIDWWQRALWTLGQTPAITHEAQFDQYAAQLAQLLVDGLGKRAMDNAAVSDFLKTRPGALAIALGARMDEWRMRAGN